MLKKKIRRIESKLFFSFLDWKQSSYAAVTTQRRKPKTSFEERCKKMHASILCSKTVEKLEDLESIC